MTPGLADEADSDGDGSPDRPDAVSAAVAAAQLDEPVEDLSQRDESTKVMANPDGSVTEELFGAPMWVEDARGNWVDVDYTLVPRPDGGFAPKAAPTELVIDAGQKEFARLTLQDGTETVWSWPEVLPSPSVDGPVATYAVADGVDLLVIATSRGVSTRIRVNTPQAVAPAFRVNVRTVGAALEKTDDGQLVVTDGGLGDAVATTAPLVAWDARMDEWGDPVKVVPVDARLAATASAGGQTDHALTLRLQPELMNDPEVMYPITIDPDMAGFAPMQDTWVREGVTWISDLYYRLLVGSSADHENSNPAWSYIQWDNTKLRNRTISSAEVGFFQYMAASCSARTVMVYPVTSAWDDATTKFSSNPPVDSVVETRSQWNNNVGATGCTPAGGWMRANVTAMAQKWADTADHGGFANYGLRLSVPVANERDFSFERRLCSVDYDPTHTSCNSASRTPYLKFTYTNRAPWPPTTPTLSSSGTTATGLWTSTSSPTFGGTTVGVAGATVKLTYEVRTSETAAAVTASCTSQLTTPGQQMPCAVSGLADRTIYVVRAKGTDSNGLVGPWSDWEPFGVDKALVFEADDGAFEDADPRLVVPPPAEVEFDAPIKLPLASTVDEVSGDQIWSSAEGEFTIDGPASAIVNGPVTMASPYTGGLTGIPASVQEELTQAGVNLDSLDTTEDPGTWNAPSQETLSAAGDCDIPLGADLASGLEACAIRNSPPTLPTNTTHATPTLAPPAGCETVGRATYLSRFRACAVVKGKMHIVNLLGQVLGSINIEIKTHIRGSRSSLTQANTTWVRRTTSSGVGSSRELTLVSATMKCASILCGATSGGLTNATIAATWREMNGTVTSDVPQRMKAPTGSYWDLRFSTAGTIGQPAFKSPQLVLRCDNNSVRGSGKGCVFPSVTPVLALSRSGPAAGVAIHLAKAIASELPNTLTRATVAVKDANRKKACPSTLVRNPGYECDEYPFASSQQGAASGGKVRVFAGCTWAIVTGSGAAGYSRCQVLKGQNKKGGSVLNNLYTHNRVIVGDKYRVRIHP